MHLKRISEIGDLPIGFYWQSDRLIVSFFRFILFAIATGDWNKVHINPFTAWRFRSNLKSLTCCGDFVLALTKSGIHKILEFDEDIEIIALGYGSVELKRPLHIGMFYQYSYTLMSRSVKKGRAYCDWLIEVKTEKGEPIASSTWRMFYSPVERRRFVQPILKKLLETVAEIYRHPVDSILFLLFAFVLIYCCLNYQLPFDSPWALPLGP
jgi:hypothetical protein